MSFGGSAFLNPALLAALLALPAIWWLLRTVPPAPKRVEFPATRILVGIEDKEKQPDKTPWWLTLIRMLAATLMILALAEPVLNPITHGGTSPATVRSPSSSTTAGPRHRAGRTRTAQMERLIAEAESQGRSVVIAPTARVSRFAIAEDRGGRAGALVGGCRAAAIRMRRIGQETGAALTQALKRSVRRVGVSGSPTASTTMAERARLPTSCVGLARGGSATLVELPARAGSARGRRRPRPGRAARGAGAARRRVARGRA